MGSANSNVVDLKAYAKAQAVASLKQDNVEANIGKYRGFLRQHDNEVSALLERKHKLKDIQDHKDDSVLIERGLVHISDWLEDAIADAANEKTKSQNQAWLKQCEQLISRNERIKKSIADDMSACRYVEGKKTIDPIKIVGFLVGTPWALVTVIKTDPDAKTLKEYAIGVGVGAAFAFHHQAGDLLTRAGRSIANNPRVQAVGRSMHRATITSTMIGALAIEEAKGFRASRPQSVRISPEGISL